MIQIQYLLYNKYHDIIEDKAYINKFFSKKKKKSQDQKLEINKGIFNLVNDVNLMVNSSDYVDILGSIANAQDEVQSD